MTEINIENIISKAEKISEELKPLMLAGKHTASTAESCTGGLVARLFTEIPGSSEYYMGGVVSYTNEIKMAYLGVRSDTLEKYTAVSAQTAEEMACGVRNGMKTDFGLSVTGIAGPGGATEENPVGSVYFGLSSTKGTQTFHKIFPGGRSAVRAQAALFILEKLKEAIISI
ncbi:MAG: CinA family protein [Elusimicrobiales bacterium]|nr:CinA family protein [Elusimicrobiales bacterium]